MVMGFDEIETAFLSDVGMRRSHNQDACGTLLAADLDQWRESGHIFLVADGMGAHAVGELASELAVGIIPHTYGKYSRQGAQTGLRKAFVEANASIHARGQQNREFEGMGTTSTALLVRPEGVWVGHVGDSRAYRIRGHVIEQLSFDHSLVWEYARRQGVDPEQVHGIPSNVIIRSLGPEPLVTVDVEGPHPIQPGDVYLLCSDGLSGQVSDHEIGVVASTLPAADACRFLVDLANLRGGPDNISVIIIRIPGQTDGNGAEAAAPAKNTWVRTPPWWLLCLFGGAILASSAVLMKAYDLPGVLFVFLLAICTIGPGIVGLVRQLFQDRETETMEEEEPGEPRIYRSVSCVLETPLLDKLARTTEALRQRAVEKELEINSEKFEQLYSEARKLRESGDVAGAFREYCRAMSVLTEAMQRQRGKEEVFQPLWDKNSV